MTDILDTEATSFETILDQCERVVDGARCPNFLPEGHHPKRKYCDDHQPPQSKPKKDRETPPRSVNVNVKMPNPGKTKAASDAEAVEQGALAMLGFLPLVFAITGDDVCSTATTNALPQIAKQLGELSKYHPGLKKVFAPANSTGEAMAWIGLGLAAAPMLLAILAHHKLLSPKIANSIAPLLAAFSTDAI